MGRITDYSYNFFDELTQTDQRTADLYEGNITSTNYYYDGVGNLTAVIDGNSNDTTDYTYTARNQVQSMTTHPGYDETGYALIDDTTRYTYDLAGNLKTLEDPDGTPVPGGFEAKPLL